MRRALMKGEREIRERAALYQELIVQAMEQRERGRGWRPELDLLLLTMVDRLEALLWVVDELPDDIFEGEATLH